MSDPVWKTDSISLTLPHLERESLVLRMHQLLSQPDKEIIILNTPAGTGKTSLLRLLEAKYNQDSTIRFVRIPQHRIDLFGNMFSLGLDVEKMTIDPKSSMADTSKMFFIMIDDAHNSWQKRSQLLMEAEVIVAMNKAGDDDNAHNIVNNAAKIGGVATDNEPLEMVDGSYFSFWEQLVKGADMLPKHVKFIVSATRKLVSDGETPTDMSQLPAFSRSDFVLSDAEACQLLDISAKRLWERDVRSLSAVLSSDVQCREMITSMCGGIAAALARTVNYLCDIWGKEAQTSSDVMRSLLSANILQSYHRCFPVPDDLKSLSAPVRKALAHCIGVGSFPLSSVQDVSARAALELLVKRGVLFKEHERDDSATIAFTAPIAQRFLSKLVYPHRSAQALPVDISAETLVLEAIGAMSALDLSAGVAPENTGVPAALLPSPAHDHRHRLRHHS